MIGSGFSELLKAFDGRGVRCLIAAGQAVRLRPERRCSKFRFAEDKNRAIPTRAGKTHSQMLSPLMAVIT